MEKLLKSILKTLSLSQLPLHDSVSSIINDASSILENETKSFRPLNQDAKPGSLLDFTQSDNLPLIIIPDIHARNYFIKNILQFNLSQCKDFLPSIKTNKNITVFEALQKNLVQIICVGDALHTERNTIERWNFAEIEFENNIYTGPAMTAEMTECFSTLLGLMKLKISFPNNFHFLKGNHENIYNQTQDGDYGFRKFADEGQMVKTFINEYYGEDILYLISCYENALPVIAATKNCVISHAEPRISYTKDELINARLNPQIIDNLTWTSNEQAEENSAEQIIKNLIPENNEKAVYFGGHRPVHANYRLLQNGKYIQIHNPDKQNIVLVYNNKEFNPQTDIVGVSDE